MSRWDRDEVDEEEKLDKLRLENETETIKSDMLEKKILQRQLKKKYGRNWKNMLHGMRDNETMRQLANTGSGFDITKGRQNERDILPNQNARFRLM